MGAPDVGEHRRRKAGSMSTEPKTYGGSVTTQAHLRELWALLGASTQQEARRALQQLLKNSYCNA